MTRVLRTTAMVTALVLIALLLPAGAFAKTLEEWAFKNARSLLDVAAFVPEDKCLTETDCPYLAPHPLRGTVNEPKNVTITSAFLAQLKGKEVTEFAKILTNNAKNLFYKMK